MKSAALGLILSAFSTVAAASNSGVTYQGRILKPDNSPLSGAVTQFKMQIRTPDSQNCLMYEEIQSQDMRNSNGAFSLTVNDGSGARTDTTGLTLDRIFANRGTFTLDASTCSSGAGTYLPNASDGRNLVVLFKDETMSTWEPIPAQKINFVPFAFESKQIAGFTADSLLRVVNGSGDPLTGVAPLSNAQYTALLALSNGTSTAYTPEGQLNGSAMPTMASGEVLGWNGTSWVSTSPVPAAGSITSTMIQAAAVGTSQMASNVTISTSGTVGAAVTTTRDFKIFAASPSTFAIDMQAPALTASYSLVWPMNAGASGQVLTTNGSGTLSWAAPAVSTQWTNHGANVSYDGGGNVGIGTTSPSYPLSVNGQISASNLSPSMLSQRSTTGWNSWYKVAEYDGNQQYDSVGTFLDITLGDGWENTGASATLWFRAKEQYLHSPYIELYVLNSTPAFTPSSFAYVADNSGSAVKVSLYVQAPYDYNSIKIQPRSLNLSANDPANPPQFYLLPSPASSSTTPSGAVFAVNSTFNPSMANTIAYMGNVGIGTTSPATPLEVLGTTNASTSIQVTNANAGTAALPQVLVNNGTSTLQLFVPGVGYSSTGDYQPNWGVVRASNASNGLILSTAKSTGATIMRVYNTEMMRVMTAGVGIGTTSPSARLTLGAGAAAAGKAPLKFTSGTLLTTAEDGAMEYNSASGLWFTIGSTRYVIPTNTAAGNYSNVSTISNAGGSITMTPSAGNSVVVNQSTASTSSSTGALVVNGGVGVAGAINTASNITAGGAVTATTNMVTPQIYGSTAASGAIRIDGTSNATPGNVYLASAGGNVGIGTTSPSTSKLLVQGDVSVNGSFNVNGGISTNGEFRADFQNIRYGSLSTTIESAIFSGGNAGVAIDAGNSGSATAFMVYKGAFYRAGTNASELMRVQSNGFVGIGTTSPSAKLDVAGAIKTSTGITFGDGSSQTTAAGSWTYQTQSANFAVSATGANLYLTSNAINATMPSASSVPANFKVKFVTSDSNTLRLVFNGTDKIDGTVFSSIFLTAAHAVVTLVSDGTQWFSSDYSGSVVYNCLHGSATFTVAGANAYTHPNFACSAVTVKLWGGGGGAGGNDSNPGATGGGGAYVTSVISVSAGSSLTMNVGAGGNVGASGASGSGGGASVFGGGAAGGNAGSSGTSGAGGSGGGASSIVSSGSSLVVAGGGGGGGGGGGSGAGGAGGGGGVSGSSADGVGGLVGASATSTGVAGTTNASDTGGGGGGGGGYLGGGGGAYGATGNGGGGGAGGTSFGTTINNGSGSAPGNPYDSQRAGAGVGGVQGTAGGYGSAGLITLTY